MRIINKEDLHNMINNFEHNELATYIDALRTCIHGKKLIIFTNYWQPFGADTINFFHRYGIKVDFLVDSTFSVRANVLDVPWMSREDFEKAHNVRIVVSSEKWEYQNIISILTYMKKHELTFPNITLSMFSIWDMIIILTFKKEIIDTCEVLSEESREKYFYYVRHKLTNNYYDFIKMSDMATMRGTDVLYFTQNFLSYGHNEILVDVGGFDGDSAKTFEIQMQGEYEKIYIFEPIDEQFEDINEKLKSGYFLKPWKIVLEKMAVLNFNGEANFLKKGSGSQIYAEGEGDGKVSVIKLDDYMLNKNVTFIKMDIEGAELDALNGAARLISEQKPKLAVSIYHTPVDFFRIPLLLHKINPNYKLYFRQHNCETFFETVCYAQNITCCEF